MPIDQPDTDRDARQQVAAVVARCGAARAARRFPDLADCFASDMVIVAPDRTRIARRGMKAARR